MRVGGEGFYLCFFIIRLIFIPNYERAGIFWCIIHWNCSQYSYSSHEGSMYEGHCIRITMLFYFFMRTSRAENSKDRVKQLPASRSFEYKQEVKLWWGIDRCHVILYQIQVLSEFNELDASELLYGKKKLKKWCVIDDQWTCSPNPPVLASVTRRSRTMANR